MLQKHVCTLSYKSLFYFGTEKTIPLLVNDECLYLRIWQFKYEQHQAIDQSHLIL